MEIQTAVARGGVIMPEQVQNPFAPFFDEFRRIVREEIAAALNDRERAAPKDWLRAEELADLYGLPKTWFEERGRAGEIARTKPGRYVLFARRDVEAYLERNKQSG
jgi:excisionase family DNA binding protein